MVCSHCHEPGHTYVRCPTISPEEKEAKEKDNKEKKIIARQRRLLRQALQQQQQEQGQVQQEQGQVQQQQEQGQAQGQQQQPQPPNPIHVKTNYSVSNTSDYEMVLYWKMNADNVLHKFVYVKPHSQTTISCIKSSHTIVCFPFLEVSDNGSVDAIDCITLPAPLRFVLYQKLLDLEGNFIIIDTDYKPSKTEVDQWRECALKSKFLLDQIHQMTGGGKTRAEYENIEAFLDMIQDIVVPTCSEIDKERAGIPSGLTNIT